MRVSSQLNTKIRLFAVVKKACVSGYMPGNIDSCDKTIPTSEGQWNESLMSTHTFVNIQKGSTTIAR